MALDLHSKVTIKSIERLELSNDVVLLRVMYRVKRGRKDYKLWALPSDFRGTGIFPLCYVLTGGKSWILTMNNWKIFEGSVSECSKIVTIANKHYMEGA
jgi:hypothetical protein